MKKHILYRALCFCGIGLMLGLSGCSTDSRETAASIIETRNLEEIKQMESAASAKEEAKANAVIYRVRPYQTDA